MNEKTNQSPAEAIAGQAATLDVNGVLVAKGRVCFYPNPDRGKFWPDEPIRLETPLAHATLALAGSSMKIRIQNVHQAHEDLWTFVIAAR